MSQLLTPPVNTPTTLFVAVSISGLPDDPPWVDPWVQMTCTDSTHQRFLGTLSEQVSNALRVLSARDSMRDCKACLYRRTELAIS